MAATASVKKLHQMIEWMAQAAPLRKPLQLKKMNDRLLLCVNEITHYFKKQTTGSGVLKKIYFLYKNVMLQIAPLKSSCFHKQQYSERAALWRKQLFRKSHLQVQLFTTALLKYILYFMDNCNYCCEIVKLTESNCSKSHPCKWKCLQLLF